MDVRERFHVTVHGRGTRPMLFVHGFGCDQSMWRYVAPAFHADYRVILFDLAGCGQSDPSTYDRSRHASLNGYAQDVLDICGELGLEDAVFVGHSVSATIGLLAAIESPERFSRLVLVGPSPRFLDDVDYTGGFSRQDIEGLVDALDSNYLGWASSMAPVIMDHPERPELAEELRNSFCRTRPDVARAFARVTFLADNRADLPRVRTPSLILQVARDVLAPLSVGEYLHQKLPASQLVVLDTRGHCPHLSAPEQTIASMKSFLQTG